jgi:hypothetical protein
MAIVLKSGSLNHLEPSGPLQACNRIALPLPYSLSKEKYLVFVSKETRNTSLDVQELPDFKDDDT